MHSQIIYTAIKEMRLLNFTYNDCHRVVEPHRYGISDSGNELLRCYQIRGNSSSGKVPAWLLLTVEKIMNLTLCQETFPKPRDGYTKDDKAMSTIFCELEKPHSRILR